MRQMSELIALKSNCEGSEGTYPSTISALMRLARRCHVNSIETADGKRQDELEEAHDAEGEICHGFIEDGHFDCVCVFCRVYGISSSLSLIVATLRFPILPLTKYGGWWRLYVDLSKHNPCGSWSHQKKQITRAAIQNSELSYCPGC